MIAGGPATSCWTASASRRTIARSSTRSSSAPATRTSWPSSGSDTKRAAARAVMTLGIALAAFAGPITAGRPWERLGAVVSIWAVLNGLLDMAIGAGVFGGARRRWQVVMGAVSVVLGASLLAWPPGMIALTLWIVLFSALYGAVTIVEASRGVRVE